MKEKLQRGKKLFSEIFNSEGVDFTEIPLKKAILFLSIPMVLEMIMESTFAIVDIFFVAKLGADAIATVGITESLMTLLYSIAIGLSIGTTALVSRRIGEKRPKEAAHYGWQAIIVGSFISIIIGVLGAMYASDLLSVMGASDQLIEKHGGFTTIMFGGNIVIILLFVNNAIFRGAGDALISMKVLFLANALNMILDPIFIFGLGPIPAFGVEGAAIATTTGRATAVIWQFWILFGGSARVHFVKKELHIKFKDMWHLLDLSIGGMFQMLIPHISWVAMVRIVSHFGSEVVAGYTLAIRVLIFSLLPSVGISNAASTLVGQNLGADHPQRAERTIWVTAIVNIVVLGFIALFFMFIPTLFIEAFTTDSKVIEYGANCLRIIGYGMIAYGLGMVLIQAFNGAGDTRTPTYINLFAFWAMEIPLAYLFAINLDFGPNGVYYSILISESTMSLIVFYFFRKGYWKSFKA